MGSGAVLTGDRLTTLYEQHAGSLFGYCARRTAEMLGRPAGAPT